MFHARRRESAFLGCHIQNHSTDVLLSREQYDEGEIVDTAVVVTEWALFASKIESFVETHDKALGED